MPVKALGKCQTLLTLARKEMARKSAILQLLGTVGLIVMVFGYEHFPVWANIGLLTVLAVVYALQIAMLLPQKRFTLLLLLRVVLFCLICAVLGYFVLSEF